MITAEILTAGDGFICGFRLKGHAGAGPYGHDLVCAAVSGLAQSVIGALQDEAKVNPDYVLAEGYISCDIADDSGWDDTQRIKAESIMRTFEIGAKQIEESYNPRLVKVVRRPYREEIK